MRRQGKGAGEGGGLHSVQSLRTVEQRSVKAPEVMFQQVNVCGHHTAGSKPSIHMLQLE